MGGEPGTFDRFEVIEALGSGGFATVWLVNDPVLDLRVALKVLADNWSRHRTIRARFIEEARVLRQLNSTRVVSVHEVGELNDGRPYFVMGWADRGTLSQRIKDRNATGSQFTVAETCSIVAEIARAVADVHDHGRIHRDIKPANILIASTDSRSNTPIHGLANDERLVLADFGLARTVDATAFTFISGSPAYVAPEQARGIDQLTEQADLFPLGIIAAELLTGTRPADRPTMADAAQSQIDLEAHFAAVGIDPGRPLTTTLNQLVSPTPEHRPRSAQETAALFTRIIDPDQTHPDSTTQVMTQLVGPPTARPPTRTGDRRRSPRPALLTIAGAALAVTIAAAGALILLPTDRQPDETTTTTATTTPAPGPSSTTQTATPSTAPTETAVANSAPTPFPFPDVAVVTIDTDTQLTAVIAAPLQDVIDYYFQQTHDGWIIEPATINGDEASFTAESSDRLGRVTLKPTAQTVGSGVIEISVSYQGA